MSTGDRLSPHAMASQESFAWLLFQRHSCRAFRSDPVPRPVVEGILQTAQHTASWCNVQPWQVYIVTGAPLEELRAELVLHARADEPPAPELDWPREYRGAYLQRRRESGSTLYSAVGVPRGDREASRQQAQENFALFGAPHLAILCCDEALGTHGVMDCGAWVSNFMLAALASGVATVAQAALASWPLLLRRHFSIPSNWRIVCGISFGYEDPTHKANSFRTSRAPLEEVATWVGWP